MYVPYIDLERKDLNCNYHRKEEKRMKLNFFKDWLFDLLNESEGIEISDVQSDDRSNIFTIVIADGSVFEIECRKK